MEYLGIRIYKSDLTFENQLLNIIIYYRAYHHELHRSGLDQSFLVGDRFVLTVLYQNYRRLKADVEALQIKFSCFKLI